MSVRPVLVEVCLWFGRVSEWNLPQVPVIHIVNRGYKTVQKKTMIPTYMYQTKHMYSEGKCTSLFDLSKNNNISGHDIHTVLNDLISNYSSSIHTSHLYSFYNITTGLTDTSLHIAVAYTCTFNLHTHRSRSLTQKERCTSLGPARWGSAGTASVELWPVHWWLLPWRWDSSSVGSRCPWPVWHWSLYPRRPEQLAVSITCNMIPGQYDTDITGQWIKQN